MTMKLNLLEERAKYFVEEFGNFKKVKVGELDDNGFVSLEFDITSEWDVLQVFHAGFNAGFYYYKKHTMNLV